jgi:tetratricopeptide (TPR) repeat protein
VALTIGLSGILITGCAGGSPIPAAPPKRAQSLQIETLQEQGSQWLAEGNRTRARQSFELARLVAESIDDRPALVDIFHELGGLALDDGLVSQAIVFHRRALDLAEQLGETNRIMVSLGILAAAEDRNDHAEAAEALYGRAMALARQQQDRGAQAVLLNNMGLLCQRKGDVESARQAYRQASEMNRQLGRREAEASNHVNLGLLAEAQEEFEQADQEFTRALELDKEVENRRGIAADLANLGRVAVRRGFNEAGLRYMDRAYRSYGAQGDRNRALEALSKAVELARKLNRLDDVGRYEAELTSLHSPASR